MSCSTRLAISVGTLGRAMLHDAAPRKRAVNARSLLRRSKAVLEPETWLWYVLCAQPRAGSRAGCHFAHRGARMFFLRTRERVRHARRVTRMPAASCQPVRPFRCFPRPLAQCERCWWNGQSADTRQKAVQDPPSVVVALQERKNPEGAGTGRCH